MSDFKEILSQTKQQIKEVTVQDVRDKLNPDNGFTLLDVREGDEWEQGHLDKAVFIPRGFLEVKADKMLTDRNQSIVVYCAGGVRSAFAAKTLQDLGYSTSIRCAAALPNGKTTECRSSPRKRSEKTRWRGTAVICEFPKWEKKAS